MNRVTMAESIMMDANQVPSPNKYSLPSFNITRSCPRRTVIKEETDREKDQKIRKWAKTDKPNPHTYKTENGQKALSQNRR